MRCVAAEVLLPERFHAAEGVPCAGCLQGGFLLSGVPCGGAGDCGAAGFAVCGRQVWVQLGDQEQKAEDRGLSSHGDSGNRCQQLSLHL